MSNNEHEEALLRVLGRTWTRVDKDGVTITISLDEKERRELLAQTPVRIRDRHPAAFYKTLCKMILAGRKQRELMVFAGSKGTLYRAIRRLKKEGLIPNTIRNRKAESEKPRRRKRRVKKK